MNDSVYRYIKTVVDDADGAIFTLLESLDYHEAIVRSTKDFKGRFLIIVDDNDKMIKWSQACSAQKDNNIRIIHHTLLTTNFKKTYNNLILDLSYDTYNKDIYESVRSVYYSNLWIIDINLENLVLFLPEHFGQGFRRCIIDEGEVRKYNLKPNDPKAYFVEYTLNSFGEDESYSYYSGIPKQTIKLNYSEFVPFKQYDALVELSLSQELKYDFLRARYNFFKKKQFEDNSFVSKERNKSYRDIRTFLNNSRIDRVKEATRWSVGHSLIVYNSKADENYADLISHNYRNHVFCDSNLDKRGKAELYESFRIKEVDTIVVNNLPDKSVLSCADAVILGELSTASRVFVKSILEQSNTPIIVPYHKNTMDENLLKIIFKDIRTETIKMPNVLKVLNDRSRKVAISL